MDRHEQLCNLIMSLDQQGKLTLNKRDRDRLMNIAMLVDEPVSGYRYRLEWPEYTAYIVKEGLAAAMEWAKDQPTKPMAVYRADGGDRWLKVRREQLASVEKERGLTGP